MKTLWGKLRGLGLGVGLMFSLHAGAMTYFVDVSNSAPVPPYTNWLTAATNIQDAIDTATNSDLILVTNGLYNTGGQAVKGRTLTNRVAVTKPLTVQSVNGPAVTVIQGYQVPSTKTGNEAVRCVYLTNYAALIGFTLTNGASRQTGNLVYEQSGAGIFCETNNAVVSNCVIVDNMAIAYGGGVYFGTLNNCQIISNQANGYSAGGGGGAWGGMLNNCTLTGNIGNVGGGAMKCALNSCIISNNSSSSGGGAHSSTLNNCTIIGNSASTPVGGSFSSSGGVNSSILTNCMIANNTAPTAGGVAASVLYNCSIIGNQATNGSGGGASSCTLYNCLIQANVATNAKATANGGGISQGQTTINCTIVSNTANNCGGVYDTPLNNCIIYYNTAITGTNQNYLSSRALNYCSTTPLPGNGTGNFTNAPLFVNVTNDYHLQSNSLCINSGNNTFVVGTNDLDGNPRVVGGAVDIGAFEFQTPASVFSYAWAQQYGLPTDGTADYVDSDSDGMNNWQEWRAGTNPTNAASALNLTSPTNSLSGNKVTWQSVSGVTYYLQRGTNLAAQPPFTSLVSNLVGQAVLTSYTDSTATNATPYFYRVGVQ